jgi:hypothetical protein
MVVLRVTIVSLLASIALYSPKVLAGNQSFDAGNVLNRLECVILKEEEISWRRQTRKQGAWSRGDQSVWDQHEFLLRFVESHIRPFMDEEAEQLVRAAYWPDGVDPHVAVYNSRTGDCARLYATLTGQFIPTLMSRTKMRLSASPGDEPL